MERPTCGTCPYFDEYEHSSYCRRHPPATLYIGDDDERMPCFSTTWPAVVANNFCGEHPEFPAYIASLKTQDDDPRKEDARWLTRPNC